MMRLLHIFIDICLLRKGPQHLPSSLVLTVLCIAAYLAASIGYMRLTAEDRSIATGWSLISSLMLLATVALLLSARGLFARFHQTVCAFAGTGTLLTLVFLPISHAILTAQDAGGVVSLPIALAWFALLVWSFVLDAHIYRNALSVSFTSGMLITCLLFALSRFLFNRYTGASP